MRLILSTALATAVLLTGPMVASSADSSQFKEGKHYTTLTIPQPSQAAAGKVEVTEVFSYGCPACNQFQSTMQQIKAALPKNAQLVLVHASWNKGESWPVFQRAYAAALSLGIAEKIHDAMFAAIWADNGPLAVVDRRTNRLKSPQPTIEDVARFLESGKYTTAAQFLATAKSFAVETRIRQFDALVKGYAVPGTPSLIVGGRYRLETNSGTSTAELNALISYLVQKAGG